MRPPDRQPFRRPAPRPAARSRRPAGPSAPPPAEPTSPGHRRELLKATYARLARLAHVPVAELVAADADRLMAVAAALPPTDGRQGDARRLAAKAIRLRG